MSIVLRPWSHPEEWLAAFQEALPDRTFELWPDVADPEAVEYAILSPAGREALAALPNLKAILTLSAGVEFLHDLDLPDIPVVRLNDPAMSNEMAAYVSHWIAHFQKRYDRYLEHQNGPQWTEEPYRPAWDYPVGILGYGSIGARLGEVLAEVDHPINAWSRTGRSVDGVTSYAGAEELPAFLSASAAVVNVLPSTPDTHHLMNEERFAQMQPGAVYVSIGRGTTTDETALHDAVDRGHLHAAVLDVTDPEPLPEDSPLWSHPRIRITPHISGYTHHRTAVPIVVANIHRIESGEEPYPLYRAGRRY